VLIIDGTELSGATPSPSRTRRCSRLIRVTSSWDAAPQMPGASSQYKGASARIHGGELVEVGVEVGRQQLDLVARRMCRCSGAGPIEDGKGDDMSDHQGEPTVAGDGPTPEPTAAVDAMAPPTAPPAATGEALADPTPPDAPPPDPVGTSWSSGAKATVAVLVVVAILGIVGTVVGFSQASSADDDLAAAEADRDAAIVAADAAAEERDELAGQLTDNEATIAELTSERDQAVVDGEVLAEELAAETERADNAEAALGAIGELLPLEIDASLDGFDLVGSYSLQLAEAFCEGLPGCGTVPGAATVSIQTTAEGFLQLVIPNVLSVGLFDTGGSLFGITDSSTVVGPCGTTPRPARVSVTMFADGVTVDGDGSRTLTGLGASLVVDAPAVEGCGAGLVFYGGALTPTG
jgi:hypothetical protein